MRKNLIYLIILIIFGIAAYILFKREKKASVETDYTRNFGYRDTSNITKIFIADKTSNKIILKRENKTWTINHDNKASQFQIDLLLSTIFQMRVNRPVQKAAVKNMLNRINTDGIKLELYRDNETNPFQVFYIGTTLPNEKNGTVMVKDNAQSPYLVHIPGFEGDLRPRFSPFDYNWREKMLLSESKESIASIEIEYPNYNSESFILKSINPDKYIVINKDNKEENANTGIAKNYLDQLKKVYSEGFMNTSSKKDSCAKAQAFAKVNIQKKNGDKLQFTFHRKIADEHTKSFLIENGDTTNIDAEKMYVFTNKNDFALVAINHYSKLLNTYTNLSRKK